MIVEENSMKLLHYYVINNKSIWRLYKDKMLGISVSFINVFIAILCYNLSFYDMLRSPVCYTC